MELVYVAIFVGCILLLWLQAYVAKQFEEAAEMKGHYGKKYFWICFWLSFVGYLLVIALPNLKGNQKKANDDEDELPDL